MVRMINDGDAAPFSAGTCARTRPVQRARGRARARVRARDMANLRTKILDFRGLDSNIILVLRGGFPMSTGSFPESLSQRILAGIILVGRLDVCAYSRSFRACAPGN